MGPQSLLPLSSAALCLGQAAAGVSYLDARAQDNRYRGLIVPDGHLLGSFGPLVEVAAAAGLIPLLIASLATLRRN